jgi:thiol-disulfide isomerase/thioredoxin
MHTRFRTARILIPLTLAAAGCQSVTGVRPSAAPKIRTITSIGDKPQTVVAGAPGDSVRTNPGGTTPKPEADNRISGRVIDETGRPVPNTRVRVAISGAVTGRATVATADDAGRFTLHGLRPNTSYNLIAEDEQGIALGRATAETSDNQVRIKLTSLADEEQPRRRVDRASDRSADSSDDSSEELPPRVNQEDLLPPPPPEVSAAPPSDFEGDAAPRSLTSGRGVSWRRGGGGSRDDAAPDEHVTPVRDRTRPPVQPPPTSPRAEMIDDDGPDPLPPAREGTGAPRRSLPNERSSSVDPSVSARGGLQSEPGAFAPALTEQPPANPARRANSSDPESSRRESIPFEPPAPNRSASAEAVPSTIPTQAPVVPTSPSNANDADPRPPEPAPVVIPTQPAAPSGSAGPDAVPNIPAPVDPAPSAPSSSKPTPEDAPAPAPAIPAETPTSPETGAPPANPPASPNPAADAANADDQAAAPARRRPTWGEVESNRLPQLAIGNPSARRPSGGAGATSRFSGRPKQSTANREDSSIVQAACQYDPKTQRLVDFRLPDLQNQPVQLSQLDGDLILLDFWGTWCGPCIDTVPHLVQLQKRYGKRLTVVGIAYEEGSAAERAALVDQAAKKLGINYTVLLGGADGRPCPLQAALFIQAYPTMVLLDRQGHILWRISGSDARTLARLDKAIATKASEAGVVRR